jgi:heterodisulfide reductase subunit A2
MPSSANDIIVLGSGVAGLTSALTFADMGYSTTIVERKDEFGGHAVEWTCMATVRCAKCGACQSQELRQKALSHPKITVEAGAELTGLEGDPGKFVAMVRTNDGEKKIPASAVVVSTGFKPFDAKRDTMLGYGRFPGVFTIVDVDEALRADAISNFVPTDLENPRIAFIQCVGSRNQVEKRDYCSQFCCKNTVRQSRRIKYLLPKAQITVFYIDLQVMGKEFRTFFKASQGEINYIQGAPAEVVPVEKEGPYKLFAIDPITGETVGHEFDRVVLAIGVDHEQGNTTLAETLGIELNDRGFFKAEGNRSSRDGVYLAGACAGPTAIPSAIAHGMAAAVEVRKNFAPKKAEGKPIIIHRFA